MEKTYAYHKPSEDGIKKITELRHLFSHVHDEIVRLTPKSREQAVALTNLETTAMWTIKAQVINDEGSVIIAE